jgi:shikimate dehydrogenase
VRAGRVLQLSRPSGATKLAAVIGDPVRHSLSPVLHNAAFEATGLDWVYVALHVPAGAGRSAVDAMRTLGIAGLSVTMPHKAAVAGAVDRLTPSAERLGAVNTVVRRGSDLVGDSTDGQGFLDALGAETGVDPTGRRALVLGTGGAARAVCLALAGAGVASLGVVGRRPEAVAAVVALCNGRFRSGSVRGGAVRAGPARAGSIDEVDGAELVVNATPVGMGGAPEGLPFGLDTSRLGSGQVVVDLIYHPAASELVVAARARGATATNGVGMLVHQAGHQFTLWTGVQAPLEVMAGAARRVMAERERTGGV